MLRHLNALQAVNTPTRSEIRFTALPGHPLPADIRQQAEALFGEDLSSVRLFISPGVSRYRARALTSGSFIYVSPSEYAPGTERWMRLLGHELAHVVQQRRGEARNPRSYGVMAVRDLQLEAEAHRSGQALQLACATLQRPTGVALTPSPAILQPMENSFPVLPGRPGHSPDCDGWTYHHVLPWRYYWLAGYLLAYIARQIGLHHAYAPKSLIGSLNNATKKDSKDTSGKSHKSSKNNQSYKSGKDKKNKQMGPSTGISSGISSFLTDYEANHLLKLFKSMHHTGDGTELLQQRVQANDQSLSLSDVASTCTNPKFGGFAGISPDQRLDDPKNGPELNKPANAAQDWWSALAALKQALETCCPAIKNANSGTELRFTLTDTPAHTLINSITLLTASKMNEVYPFNANDWVYQANSSVHGLELVEGEASTSAPVAVFRLKTLRDKYFHAASMQFVRGTQTRNRLFWLAVAQMKTAPGLRVPHGGNATSITTELPAETQAPRVIQHMYGSELRDMAANAGARLKHLDPTWVNLSTLERARLSWFSKDIQLELDFPERPQSGAQCVLCEKLAANFALDHMTPWRQYVAVMIDPDNIDKRADGIYVRMSVVKALYNDPQNLWWICSSCNSQKTDKLPETADHASGDFSKGTLGRNTALSFSSMDK